MKNNLKSIVICAAALLMVLPSMAQKNNTLTKQEKKEGWILLFNGKDFNGWHKYNSKEMAPEWVIEEEAMKVPQGKKAGNGSGADVIFDKKFSNFELSLDWKVEKQGNSGIFYYVQQIEGQPVYYAAPEIQVLDNEFASDRIEPSHRAGSLYDMIAAEPQNAKPFGEWNNIVIRVKDGHVTHTQNGVKVVEYDLWGPQWKELVAKSKFKTWPGFVDGPAKEGYIGLQDHGWATWFRNIKIKEL